MSIIDRHPVAVPGSTTDGIAIGRIARVAASAAMGGFLFGFDTAVINGAVDAIKVWSNAVPWLLGFSVAGALLGSAVGAWFAGPLADRYGRITAMKIAALVFLMHRDQLKSDAGAQQATAAAQQAMLVDNPMRLYWA